MENLNFKIKNSLSIGEYITWTLEMDTPLMLLMLLGVKIEQVKPLKSE